MMNDQQKELLDIITKTISEFNSKETYLIKNNLSERCICSKFAQHLDKSIKSNNNYSGYDVDVEYNRGLNGNDSEPKKIFDGNITVDIIIHKRGYNPIFGFDNLICIEMKKSNDRRGKVGIYSDQKRLKALTSYEYGFCYKLGVMLLANIKEQRLEILEPIYKLN